MKKVIALVVAAMMVLGMATSVFAAEAMVSDALIDPINDWAQYDELVAQIKAETDMAKRTEMMHQAEDILMATY